MASVNPSEVIHEHKVTTEHNDVLECGVIRVNAGEKAVAYAALGQTTVTICRDAYGIVRVEIDDAAEEAVHVTANLQALTRADPDIDQPWHDWDTDLDKP